MRLLSSYRLSPENNARIAESVRALGGEFIPVSFDDELDEIVRLLEEHIGEATIFLGGRLNKEQWDRAKNLEWIHVPWAGVNALLGVDGIRESDIPITNSSGVMADSVADQVMAYLIMLNRSLAKQIRWGLQKEWNRYTTVEHPDRRVLRGMTVGILGYGAIGRAVAGRAGGFGMRVIGTKRSLGTEEPELDRIYGPEDLHLFLGESDFVVVALPLTRETEGLMGKAEFRAMKPTAYIVNIARGAIITEGELIEALREGRIAGAALDVFEQEPLPEDSVLWEMENVIVTPHSSGGFVGFGDAVTDLFLENLSRFVKGQPLQNRVDPRNGY